MLRVDIVDLSARGVVLPSDRVGMVLAQPSLSMTPSEPFECTAESRPHQLQMIKDTLAVALACPHGVEKTHFTVFPEYSIPGLAGIAVIESMLQAANWPIGTIVIGGTDALSKLAFESLTNGANTHCAPLPAIGDEKWINCAITWVKGAGGIVERWLQPKLCPAGPERDIQFQAMFRGAAVFAFRGLFSNNTQYNFCSIICFDWIARIDGEQPWYGILNALAQGVAPNELSLSWFFVIQSNPKPSHRTFLAEIPLFFDQNTLPHVRRERTCLVFANSGGKAVPGRAETYGNTSLVFSEQAQFQDPTCYPTFAGGERRSAPDLRLPNKEILFRERGACIHSFAQINAGSLVGGAAGRTIAVDNAFVFPLDATADPRAPAGPVPACIKWLNDELDDLSSKQLGTYYPAARLAADADIAHRQCIADLRMLPAKSAMSAISLAAEGSTAKHADQWNHVEVDALEHLLYTLDIVRLGFDLSTVDATPAHATVDMMNQVVDLLAVRGISHERCVEHSKTFLPMPRRQVLLVSRDRDNNTWRQKFGSFLATAIPRLGADHKITDPMGGLLHLGYSNLLAIFQTSATRIAVQEAIDAEFAA